MMAMSATLRSKALAGALMIGGLGLGVAPAHAQGFGIAIYGGSPEGYYGGGYRGGGACGARNYNLATDGSGYGGACYGLPGYNPSLPWSPAQQQGWREGQVFWETGLIPNHPLSPAEAQGFLAGERRAAFGGWRP
jgi:hypothetical protein